MAFNSWNYQTVAGLMVALLATPRPGRSQDSVRFTLGEVVVSARRPAAERSATVRLVTREDIVASGAHTLDQALSLLPGLRVRTGSDGVPRSDVRGFRSRHVVMLLDGIPLNAAFDGQADLTTVPVEQIEAIKFTPGPSSVLYPSGTLGGVIDVITRAGSGNWRGDAALKGGAGEMRLGRFALGAGTQELNGFFAGSAFTRSGLPSVNTSPAALGTTASMRSVERANSDRTRSNVFASLTARPNASAQVGAVVTLSRTAYGVPPISATTTNDPFATRRVFDRVTDADGVALQMSGSYAAGPALLVRGWTFLNQLERTAARFDDSTYSSMSDSTVRGAFLDRSRTRMSGGTLQAAMAASRVGRLTLALDAARDGWRDDLLIRDVALGGGGGGGGGGRGVGGGVITKYGTRTAHDDRVVRRYSASLEYETPPTAYGGFVLGFAHRSFDRDSGRSAGNELMAGAFVDARQGSRLRVAAARKIRFPTIRQLYDPDGGNSTLGPERASTLEGGIDQSFWRRSNVSLSAFVTTVRGFIERPGPGESFANHNRYRFTGIELSADTRAWTRLFLRFGHTFLSTEDQSPGATRQALQNQPRHRTTAELRYAHRAGLSLSASTLRVADQVFYARTAPFQSARLPNYTVVNARVAQTVGRNGELYLGADNLFDRIYEEEYGFPAATRIVYAGVAVHW